MSIYIPSHIKITVHGDDGNVKYIQNYADFLSSPNFEVQAEIYGRTLIDILTQEAYINANMQLNHVFTGNVKADATRIIGSIAESLVVDWCNKYPEVNRTLGMYARGGVRRSNVLDDYIAVATGSQRTKNLFEQYYNPCDTQRDILWVNKYNNEDQLLAISPRQSRSSAKPAGLQVKASQDGISYVLPCIQDYHYPILYFDLNGDWGAVYKKVLQDHPSSILINPDELQHEMRHVLRGYFNILVEVINGNRSLERVIKDAQYNGDSVLLAGLDTSEFTFNPKIILPK